MAQRDKERIDVLLVERGLVDTRTQAQARLLAGDVVVDDQRVDKAGTRVSREAAIRLKGEAPRFVSRGGDKLAAALERWPIAVSDARCLDVGASTGGFTDVLLQAGAAEVVAVDVGHNQLAWKIRQDPRVEVRERCHILKMDPLVPPAAICVVDVSFISLTRVLPALGAHLTERAALYLLIKPQFEVGREAIGKKGVVRDEAARADALARVLACAADAGFAPRGHAESPLLGAEGNVEYIAALSRGGSVAS